MRFSKNGRWQTSKQQIGLKDRREIHNPRDHLIKILRSYLQLKLNIRLSFPRNVIYDLKK